MRVFTHIHSHLPIHSLPATHTQADLDYVLQLTTQKLLERRLQTKVYKQSLAKSIHHARVLIRQRHIRCVAWFEFDWFGFVCQASRRSHQGAQFPLR